jgi:hypothetical protein
VGIQHAFDSTLIISIVQNDGLSVLFSIRETEDRRVGGDDSHVALVKNSLAKKEV